MPSVITHFDGSDIQRMLQQWFQETNSQFWNRKTKQKYLKNSGNSFERLPYQMWSISNYGPCTGAAFTHIMPPPLLQVQPLSLLGSQVNVISVQSLLERML